MKLSKVWWKGTYIGLYGCDGRCFLTSFRCSAYEFGAVQYSNSTQNWLLASELSEGTHGRISYRAQAWLMRLIQCGALTAFKINTFTKIRHSLGWGATVIAKQAASDFAKVEGRIVAGEWWLIRQRIFVFCFEVSSAET